MVDDFRIKYVGKEHVEFLTSILREHYKISVDWSGTKYIGLTIKWNYPQQEVHISMPGYREKALLQFEDDRPQFPQNSPHQHVSPSYGAKAQYTEINVHNPLLDKVGKKEI